MKIDFVSDLHLDTWQPEQTWTWLKTRKSDYLLIAGDTSDYIEHPQKTDLYESLIHLGNNYKHVYFIDGNHEFQPNRLNVEEIKEDIIECIDPLDNVHYIPVQENIIGNVGIVGANGWWDYTFDGVDPETCLLDWKEREGFKMDTEILRHFFPYLAKLDAENLEQQIKNIYDKVDKIVVVTHVACHPDMCTSHYPGPKKRNGLYGNAMFMPIAEKYADKIKYWINGHSHDHAEASRYGIKFISNPRGRPYDFNRIDYSIKTLDI